MTRRIRPVPPLIGAALLPFSLIVSLIVSLAAPATAAQRGQRLRPLPSGAQHHCAGTAHRPGRLAGTFWDVVVRGVCVVKGGQADIEHDLIVSDGAALLAIFGRRHARLTVGGDVFVGRHGTLIMGCESKIISVFGHRQPVFPCADDPHQRHPRLNSHGVILGALIAHEPLGIVIHNSFLREDVVQRGGGGGVSCKPTGIFRLFGFPPYSDYEDSVFGDSLSVTGVHSCWFGALRNVVGIDLHVSRNRMADPDAMEVLGNLVLDNLSCTRNVPLVHFGDSGGHPNRVAGSATGGCGFRVLRWNPARGSHIPVKPRLEHISVHLRDVLAPEST